jgi:hypothetical protein
VAKLLLGVGVLVSLVATWSSWEQVRLIQEVARGANVADEALIANDDRQAFIGMIQLGIGVVVAIAFLMWVAAVSRRLQELGVSDMRYAPKWAVWGFIVPILNLWRPHQVMTELWKASDIAPGPDDPWRAKPTPAIVHFWWGILLIEGVVGRFLLSSTRTMETLDEILRVSTMTVVADALGIVTAVLGFQLVATIDGRLQASESRAGERLAVAPAPIA